MTDEEKIEQAFVSLIDSLVPVQTLPAVVTFVNIDNATCDVEFLDKDLAPHKAVHLYAGTIADTGLLIIPKLKSFVYVSIVNNDSQWAYVSLCTSIDEIRLRGNALGGLVKVEPLTSRLNAIENDLNSLKNILKSWVIVAQDGGAALKTAAAGWYSSKLNITKRKDIENEKVNHG